MKLKAWLVPGRHNKYHPHLLRPLGLSLAVALLLLTNLTYNITAAQQFQVLGYATSTSASTVINLSNQERINRGIPALGANAALTQAAQNKAADMFAQNYWSHYGPDGSTPWQFISEAGYVYTTAAENLAKDFDTSAGVVAGWMNSASHRDNILNSKLTETGVAVLNGTLLGEETTLVVAMYAAPKVTPPPPAPTPPPATTTPASQPTPPPPAPKVQEAQTTVPPTEQPNEPSPAPTNEDSSAPTAIGTTENAAPIAVETKQLDTQPVAVTEQRSWAQNASLFIISTLLLVAILKHTAVWRAERRGLRHVWLRAHPAAQYGLLLIALFANVTSGIGVIL